LHCIVVLPTSWCKWGWSITWWVRVNRWTYMTIYIFRRALNSNCLCIMLFICRNLSLGLATKARGSQGRGPKRVWEERLTFPSDLSFWELESQWTLKPLESDCKGQNTLHWGVPYINEKLLKTRCLKWARMTRLDICNTSYGKKKGRESNCQFDSRPQKVRNRPNFRACR
jgi:hypothetical protein